MFAMCDNTNIYSIVKFLRARRKYNLFKKYMLIDFITKFNLIK